MHWRAVILVMLAAGKLASPALAEEAYPGQQTAASSPKSLPDIDQAISTLNDMQRYVTQHDGTEPAFDNLYWDNKEAGIYVDVVSGEPLFSSTDKFDSGTGWPSFTKPINQSLIVEKTDDSLGMQRTEVRSSGANSHLGHVFDDGPKEQGGSRYCINSSALRFVPKAELEKQGYGEYLPLFENSPATGNSH